MKSSQKRKAIGSSRSSPEAEQTNLPKKSVDSSTSISTPISTVSTSRKSKTTNGL